MKGLKIIKKVGAGVVVYRPGDLGVQEVLLVRRRDTGLWDVPGGGRAWWEWNALAARRELREGTGLRVGRLGRLGVWGGPMQRQLSPDGELVDWTKHVFVAAYQGGQPVAREDAAEVAWWPLEALPEEISPATAGYFRALRARGRPT